jgi:hypothetical protein
MKTLQKRLLLFCALVLLNILGCSGKPPDALLPTLNQNAAVIGDLPVNPLHWRVITSAVDEPSATMSTLYGNDIAVDYVSTHSQHDYPGGSALWLVTWTKREDPRWFGAEILDQVKSVEFVTVSAAPDGRSSYSYEDYEGTPLKRSSAVELSIPNERISFLLLQRAAVMP